MGKVVFVQNIWFQQIGIQCLSAFLKAHGHECVLLIEQGEEDLPGAVARENPTLVGFSVTTGFQDWALATARAIKARCNDVPVIFGGAHPTYAPEVVREEGCDYACRGDGEHALLEAVEALEAGKSLASIENLWVKEDGEVHQNPLRRLKVNLDELPQPDHDILWRYSWFRNDPVRNFNTSRGCPYDCTYCYNYSLRRMYRGKGKYYRQRSVAHLLEEMKTITEKHRVKTVVLVDDISFVSKRWSLEFFEHYPREVGLPWICDTRPEILADEDLVRRMSEAGCYSVRFGIESGNEGMRRSMLDRRMSDNVIEKAAEHCRRYGIKMQTFNIVGLPDETLEQAFETIDLNARIKAEWPRFSLFQPYPGTPLGDVALERGQVDMDRLQEIGTSYFKDSVLTTPDIKKIENLQKLFALPTRFPATRPLVKQLCKLPPNKAFDAFFLGSIYLQYAGSSNRGLLKTLSLGARNLRHYYQSA